MVNSNETVTCLSFPEHPEHCTTIDTVRRIFSTISCLGCIFVIFVIWVFGRYTVFSQRLILLLSIAALMNAFSRLIQDSTTLEGPWCRLQGFYLTYSNYAVMLWVCCVTFNLFMNVIRNTLTAQYEKWYHSVCWGVPAAISLLPFLWDKYGPSGSWCWIVNDGNWHIGIWYAPLFIVILCLFVVYSYIVFKLYRQASNWAGTYDPETRRAQEALKEDIKPLRLYPFVFLLMSIFPLINRIQNAVSDNHVLGLVLLHTISASLQGAAYSVVFAIDRQTLKSLTPSNIKLAIQKKRAGPVVVQEYSADVVIPDPHSAAEPYATEQGFESPDAAAQSSDTSA